MLVAAATVPVTGIRRRPDRLGRRIAPDRPDGGEHNGHGA